MPTIHVAPRGPFAGADEINRMVKSLASQIVASDGMLQHTSLVGVKTRGVPLAHRIAREIQRAVGVEVDVQEIEISHYHDDAMAFVELAAHARGDVRFDVEGRRIVVVDDVVHTGGTVQVAISKLLLRGKPASIDVAALVDRLDGRELPVLTRYYGCAVLVARGDWVWVLLRDANDRQDAVSIAAKPPPGSARRRRRGSRDQLKMPGLLTWDLTDQELAVLRHVAEGQTNEEIAKAMTLAPKTIQGHLTHIFRKLKVRNRAQATFTLGRERPNG